MGSKNVIYACSEQPFRCLDLDNLHADLVFLDGVLDELHGLDDDDDDLCGEKNVPSLTRGSRLTIKMFIRVES